VLNNFSTEIPEFDIWHFLLKCAVCSSSRCMHSNWATIIGPNCCSDYTENQDSPWWPQLDWLGDSPVSTENRRLLWLAIQSNQRREIWWKELLKKSSYSWQLLCAKHPSCFTSLVWDFKFDDYETHIMHFYFRAVWLNLSKILWNFLPQISG